MPSEKNCSSPKNPPVVCTEPKFSTCAFAPSAKIPAAPAPLVSTAPKLRIVTSFALAKMPFERSPVVVRSPKLMICSPGVLVVSASSSNPLVEMSFRLTIAIYCSSLRYYLQPAVANVVGKDQSLVLVCSEIRQGQKRKCNFRYGRGLATII